MGGCVKPQLVRLARGLGATVGIGAFLGTAIFGWAYCEARRPVLRQLVVDVRQFREDAAAGIGSRQRQKRLAAEPAGRRLRVLHVSDPHMHARSGFVTDFLAEIASDVEFDFVVATGDNLSDSQSLDLLLEAFAPLLERPGCFVFGSNDYYAAKAKSWVSYLTPPGKRKKKQRREPDLPWAKMANAFMAVGWVDLGNRTQTIRVPLADGGEAVLYLAGVDDPHIRRDYLPDLRALSVSESMLEAVQGSVADPVQGAQADLQAVSVPNLRSDSQTLSMLRLQPDLFVGLTHAPYRRVLDAFTLAGVDLIFAGHTHGGQLRLPGVGALVTNTDIPCRFARGLHEWLALDPATGGSYSSLLNVSAGLGTSPFAPVRFACRPEATLLTINLPG